MTAPTAAQFKALLPEFAGETDAKCLVWIGVATQQCNATVYGTKHMNAISFLAAHLMSLGRTNPTPTATGVNENTMSLSSTAYGVMYGQLRSQVAIGLGGMVWVEPV